MIQKLRGDENIYRTLLDNLPQNIFLKDGNSVYLSCNENYARALKIKAEEIVGKTDYEFYPTELAEKYKADDKRIMESGKAEEVEEKYIREGKEFIVQTVKTPIKDEQGNVIGILGIFWDITERKKMEAILKESEGKYRSLVQNIPDVVWTTDLKGRTVFISQNVKKIYGYTPEEIFEGGNEIWFGRIHPDDIERTKKSFTALFEKEDLFDIEYRIKRKDGKWIWLRDRAMSVYEENGIKYANGIFIDITERKETEEKIKIFSNAVQNAYDSFILTDINGNVTNANESSIKVFGYSHEEILKLKVSQFTADPKDANNIVEEVKNKGKWSGETICIRKNKEKFTVLLTVSIVKDDKDNPAGTMGIFRDITESKRAEEALRESEERYKSLFKANIDGILIADPTTKKFRYANPAMCRMLGYSEEEFTRLGLADIHPKESLEQASADFEARVSGAKITSKDLPCVRKDGQVIFVSINAGTMTIGQTECMMGIFRDITERKQAEEALRETTAYLQNLITYANAPIIVWDPQFRISQFNHAFESLTGRKAGDVIGKPLDLLFPPALVENTMNIIRKTLTGERWKAVEISILHIDGSVSTVLWNSATIFAPDGKTAVAIIAQGQDITERKRAEEALRESEERYKSLFKANIDGILIADVTTKKFRYANPAICRMLGYSEEELTRMSVADIHPKEALEQVIAEFEAQASGTKITADLPCVRKDGQVISVSINASTVTINQTEYVMGIFRNVTDRKKAEEKLKKLNEEMRNTVAELEETNKEMKNFVYIASHDLREPLRKITAFGAMLGSSLKGKLAGDDAENLKFMIDGAQRMTKMIEGLLVYSRVSTQAHPSQGVDLNEIVTQLQQLELAVLIEEKQVTIESQSLPCVEADPAQIRQLMQNLIANGVKYQKKGNIPRIIITSKPASDGMVRIEVTDNGIGIKPEFQGAIFTMFKRLHSRDEYEGTGIGLAVCKKIVERHGGKIGVESQPDKGSTFWFTIPETKAVTADKNIVQTSYSS
ncbi:MAG: PAS domain S-box protein [Sedimentisphaerales bacterium]